ncbi:uncharacterized protein LOC132255963 [Phlebotomus argentipes]|uniref:uncharacterized protein LOC132255963 n=1 Tax=Phlebotomus argentipes TaxID=94469 RepID=UPI00289303BE|nr:uncharacterized protein LOC132255963 [Phlebotomus argentipes]
MGKREKERREKKRQEEKERVKKKQEEKRQEAKRRREERLRRRSLPAVSTGFVSAQDLSFHRRSSESDVSAEVHFDRGQSILSEDADRGLIYPELEDITEEPSKRQPEKSEPGMHQPDDVCKKSPRTAEKEKTKTTSIPMKKAKDRRVQVPSGHSDSPISGPSGQNPSKMLRKKRDLTTPQPTKTPAKSETTLRRPAEQLNTPPTPGSSRQIASKVTQKKKDLTTAAARQISQPIKTPGKPRITPGKLRARSDSPISGTSQQFSAQTPKERKVMTTAQPRKTPAKLGITPQRPTRGQESPKPSKPKFIFPKPSGLFSDIPLLALPPVVQTPKVLKTPARKPLKRPALLTLGTSHETTTKTPKEKKIVTPKTGEKAKGTPRKSPGRQDSPIPGPSRPKVRDEEADSAAVVTQQSSDSSISPELSSAVPEDVEETTPEPLTLFLRLPEIAQEEMETGESSRIPPEDSSKAEEFSEREGAEAVPQMHLPVPTITIDDLKLRWPETADGKPEDQPKASTSARQSIYSIERHDSVESQVSLGSRIFSMGSSFEESPVTSVMSVGEDTGFSSSQKDDSRRPSDSTSGAQGDFTESSMISPEEEVKLIQIPEREESSGLSVISSFSDSDTGIFSSQREESRRPSKETETDAELLLTRTAEVRPEEPIAEVFTAQRMESRLQAEDDASKGELPVERVSEEGRVEVEPPIDTIRRSYVYAQLPPTIPPIAEPQQQNIRQQRRRRRKQRTLDDKMKGRKRRRLLATKKRGSRGTEIMVKTNCVKLDLSKMPEKVFQYFVGFNPNRPRCAITDVFRGFRNQENSYELARLVHDGKNRAFSSRKINLRIEERRRSEISLDLGNMIEIFTVRISNTKHLRMSLRPIKRNFLTNRNKRKWSDAIAFVNSVLREALIGYWIGDICYYPKDEQLPIDFNLGINDILNGIYQKVFIGSSVYLNVDMALIPTLVFNPIQLIQLLRVMRIDLNKTLSPEDVQMLTNFLNTLPLVREDCIGRARQFVAVLKPVAEETMYDDGIGVSVQTYYERRNFIVRHPQMPAIAVETLEEEAGQGHESIWPLELCSFQANTIIFRNLTARQMNAFVSFSQWDVNRRKAVIENLIKTIEYNNVPALVDYGIRVGEELECVKARILPRRLVEYKNGAIVTPQDGSWDVTRKQFTEVKSLYSWGVLNLDWDLVEEEVGRFVDVLKTYGAQKGMTIMDPIFYHTEYNPDNRRNDRNNIFYALRMLKGEKRKDNHKGNRKENRNFVLVILPEERCKEVYRHVKIAAERTLEIITQCITSKKVRSCEGNVVNGLLGQINTKLNGANNRVQSDVKIISDELDGRVMFLGGCIVNGGQEVNCRSLNVVGMTASFDTQGFKHAGVWRYQHRQHVIIKSLSNITSDFLDNFQKQNNGKTPKKIMYYRMLSNEDKYEEVQTKEVKMIRKACLRLENYHPEIIFIGVIRRHRIKFFPEPNEDDDKPAFAMLPSGNVVPGTVVDQGIVHRLRREFFLVSHGVERGVAKPTKYIVSNTCNLTMDTVQSITYNLTHLHSLGFQSVSCVPSILYAYKVAERGKLYAQGLTIAPDRISEYSKRKQPKRELVAEFPIAAEVANSNIHFSFHEGRKKPQGGGEQSHEQPQQGPSGQQKDDRPAGLPAKQEKTEEITKTFQKSVQIESGKQKKTEGGGSGQRKKKGGPQPGPQRPLGQGGPPGPPWHQAGPQSGLPGQAGPPGQPWPQAGPQLGLSLELRDKLDLLDSLAAGWAQFGAPGQAGPPGQPWPQAGPQFGAPGQAGPPGQPWPQAGPQFGAPGQAGPPGQPWPQAGPQFGAPGQAGLPGQPWRQAGLQSQLPQQPGLQSEQPQSQSARKDEASLSPKRQEQKLPAQQVKQPTQPAKDQPGGGEKKAWKKEKRQDPERSQPQTPRQTPVAQPKGGAEPKKRASALDVALSPYKGPGTLGRAVKFEANYVFLTLKNLVDMAYHYDVAMDPDRPKKLLGEAFEKFRQMKFPKHVMAFDRMKNAYTITRLDLPPGGLTAEVEIDDPLSARKKKFKVTIQETEDYEVRMNLLKSRQAFMEAGNEGMVKRAHQCLEIIMRMHHDRPGAGNVGDGGIHVGRQFYWPPSRKIALDGVMELWNGIYHSAVFGERPLLNVDITNKGFPSAMTLLDIMREMKIDPNRTPERWAMENLKAHLNGLNISYMIPGQPASRQVKKFLDFREPANRLRFTVDGKTMTIEEYFVWKYKFKLKFPNFPVILVNPRDKNICYPAELCAVPGGQAVMKKLTENQTRFMIKHTATSTDVRKTRIYEMLQKVNFNASPVVKEFGIEVGKDFVEVDARILDAPKLEYSQKKAEFPRNGVWQMREKQFIVPTTIDCWAVFVLETRRPDLVAIHSFVDSLGRAGKALNMTIAKPMEVIQVDIGRNYKQFTQHMEKMKGKVKILLMVISGFGNDYQKVKRAAEIDYGILTQCVKHDTIVRRGDASTVNNILLKINSKLNGLNHRILSNMKVGVLKDGKFMVVGADVTHPSPDQRNIPSIVGMAASYDEDAFQYTGMWRIQDPRREMIDDLAQMIEDHLRYYKKKRNFLPNTILYYRDGVGEGDFQRVLNLEFRAIHQGAARVEANYKPKVVFIVVQKRHHTRFFPGRSQKEAVGKNNNVPPGTIVDKQIVPAQQNQFFLVAHQAIQGVAKPTKYCILVDEANLSINDLETLTYNLCYLFTRCNRSVSYVAPTYYAHLMAARGKVYVEGDNLDMNNLEREYQKRIIKDEVGKAHPMYFV